MPRFTLLLAVLVLAVGCKKADKPDGTNPGGGSGGEPSGGVISAETPKLQPRHKFKLPGERGGDRSVQVSADGKTLAAAYRTPQYKTLTQVYDLSAEPKVVAEFDSGVSVLSPSGKHILVGGNFVEPKVQEVATKKTVATLKSFFSHAFFRDENTLVVTQRSHDFPKATKGRVTVWDVAKNADAGSFDIPDNRFSDAALVGGKELWLFMSHEKFEIECYDLAGKKLARTIKPEADKPGASFTSAGIYNSVVADGSAFTSNVSKQKFYDGATGKILGEMPAEVFAGPTGFLPGGDRYLARVSKSAAQKYGLSETDLVVYDWKAGKGLAILTGQPAKQDDPLGAASADGKTLVSVTKAGEGLVFDLSSVK